MFYFFVNFRIKWKTKQFISFCWLLQKRNALVFPRCCWHYQYFFIFFSILFYVRNQFVICSNTLLYVSFICLNCQNVCTHTHTNRKWLSLNVSIYVVIIRFESFVQLQCLWSDAKSEWNWMNEKNVFYRFQWKIFIFFTRFCLANGTVEIRKIWTSF